MAAFRGKAMDDGFRVFYINSILGVGSTGRLIAGLMEELGKRGVEAKAAYGRFNAPESLNSYRILSGAAVRLHGAMSRITDRHGLYSAAATRRLIKIIEEFDPTLIHVHNVHGYYLHYKVLFDYLKACGKKLVWTLHDCWAFTGHCTHYQYIGCEKWKKGCFDCPQKREYPASFVMDASKSNYELKRRLFTGIRNLRLVTPSEWLKEQVGSSFLSEYETDVVPTGIDLETFKETDSSAIKEKYGLKGKRVLLGVANPWRERKGLKDFIRLAGRTDKDTAIVMIGPGLHKMGRLPENIRAIPKTDSAREMAQWYSLADVFVNLTYEDTFPTTNIEALACGTPVITYRAGGSMESLNEECGIGVEVGDIQGVLAALERIGQGSGSYRADLCRRRAEDFAAKKRFEEYITRIYGL